MTTLVVAPRTTDLPGESNTSVVDDIHIFFRFVDGRVSLPWLLVCWNKTVHEDGGLLDSHALPL